MSFLSSLCRAASACVFLLGMSALPAHATTYTVSNANDNGSGSLRTAVASANAQADTDVIVFDPVVFGRGRTMLLTGGAVTITRSVNIVAPSNGVTIRVNRNSGALIIRTDAVVNLSGLTFTDAAKTNAIFNDGTLMMTNCALRNNGEGSAAIYNGNGLVLDRCTFSANGGGINNLGATRITNCTFSGNSATQGGGIANSNTLRVEDTTFSSNSATQGGGGIYNTGTATIIRCTFSQNQSKGTHVSAEDFSGGGAIYNRDAGQIGIEASSISSNTATDRGGGIFNVKAGLLLSNSTVTGNSASNGGGLYNYDGQVSIRSSVISKNTATKKSESILPGDTGNFVTGGGAIYNIRSDIDNISIPSKGTLLIEDSTLSFNKAYGGGAIANVGYIKVYRSLIANNEASKYGGAISNIYKYAGKDPDQDGEDADDTNDYFVGSSLNISNSTIYNNSAPRTGGIHNTGGQVQLDSCTFKSNEATDTSSSAALANGYLNELAPIASTLNVTNTIFDDIGGEGIDIVNRKKPKGIPSGGYVIDGVMSGRSNIVRDKSGSALGSSPFGSGPENKINTNPFLGPLQDNGGPTLTCRILTGSPAIDAGDTSNFVDERAVKRPLNAAKDVGAYESRDPAGLVVNTTEDVMADDGLISLREALYYTNAVITDISITFDPKVFATPQTIELGAGLSILNKVTLIGPAVGVTLVLKSGQGRIMFIQTPTDRDVTLSHLTIANGTGVSVGGGLYTSPSSKGKVILNSCTFSGNHAEMGGGFYNNGAGLVSLNSCTFSENSASTSGGGLYNGVAIKLNACTFSRNTTEGDGAGFTNHGYGTTTLRNCTFDSNTASSAGGGFNNTPVASEITDVGNCTFSNNSAKFGAGAFSYTQGTLKGLALSNCTFSANKASYGGGGLWIAEGGITLDSCTFGGNSAYQGGSIYIIRGQVALANSIFNDASTLSLYAKPLGNAEPTQRVTFIDKGYNLSGNQAGGYLKASTSLLNTDPRLSHLTNNGGPTATFALLSQSPAIDRGSTTLASDQRGIGRPYGSGKDIGAYESNFTFSESLLVTTLVDEDDGSSDIHLGSGTSLREALAYANKKDGVDEITFAFGVGGELRLGGTALDLKDVRLMGPGGSLRVTILGNGCRVLNTQGFVFISAISINGGYVSNSAGDASGAGLSNTGDLNLYACTFTTNVAYGSVGGYGGALANWGTAAVNSCTFRNNITKGKSFNGGSAILNKGTLTLQNSTFSDNLTTPSSPNRGGAILNKGVLSLDSCTFAENSGFQGNNVQGSSIYNEGNTAQMTVTNTLFGDAKGASLVNVDGASLVDQGYNLARDDGGGLLNASTDLLNTDPQLDLFDSDHTVTPVYPLLPSSPAIDAGRTSLSTDQTGVFRPQGKSWDIGAVESNSGPNVGATAYDDFVDGRQNVTQKILASTLLANDYRALGRKTNGSLQLVSFKTPRNFEGTLKFAVIRAYPTLLTYTDKSTLIYTPRANWSGETQFEYTVLDKTTGKTYSAQVFLTIGHPSSSKSSIQSNLSPSGGAS